ncbi:MAG TPA: fumarylacetoacetate hydrolase family protein [Gemmatimonadaceae bacterium]|nr:fumarylacetoacetate hydrolase family protein [Gemmatimonadaceae bacterium]
MFGHTRTVLLLLHATAAFCIMRAVMPTPAAAQVTRYVRYAAGNTVAYGILEGETIRQLSGDLFGAPQPTGRTVRRSEVRLLAPVEPKKVIAVGLNYKSHLGERPAATYPGLFAKLPSSIVGPEADVIYPADAENLHFEGELVVVIGRRAHAVSPADAPSHVFGVTAGNDISERNWQRTDLQWFRAKASDTFGPLGPVLVTGLNYGDLLLETRVNGKVLQSQRTRDLIFDVPAIVSYVSRYVTLEPGDVIYTGTPGTTSALQPGDVVEVEIEGIGILRNRVVRTPPR